MMSLIFNNYRLGMKTSLRFRNCFDSLSKVSVSSRLFLTQPGIHLPHELESAIQEKVVVSRNRLAQLRQKYGDTVIDEVTVKTALGGMRGSRLLLCETSQVDPVEGISYRGIPIRELIELLPKATPESPPPTEALFWLLLTGDVPTVDNIRTLQEELIRRMSLPKHVSRAIDALPPTTHPMTQFIVGITACQTESSFSAHYKAGTVKKEDYWRIVLEDGLSLVAKLPQIAAQVYRRSFPASGRHSKSIPPVDPTLDWAANSAHLMGFDDLTMQDVFRLYFFIHADHEGGNVSAHAAHLVGSALADPFLSFAASMGGLAGPLHGLANQEALRFLRQMALDLHKAGKKLNDSNVKNYVESEIVGKGRVVPGFGHAVLRSTDPRFVLQREFALQKIQNDELTDLLGTCLNIVPSILMATGKVSNPYPNVDAHSGVILSYFGLKEEDFYTVLFGLSRSIGVTSQLVWDRAFNLPIERPKSVTLESLEKLALISQSKITNQEKKKKSGIP